MSIEIIATTFGGALLWSFTRFIKKNPDLENFQPKKVIYPALLGIAVGLIAISQGVDYVTAELVIGSYGGVALIETLSKYVISKFF